LTPAEAGISTTGRRRTPGLRREELAVLAGISATWYTYLEQGRDVRPSIQVLGSLSKALNLDRAERAHLFRIGGYGQGTAGHDSETTSPSTARVLTLLEPAPAYITGRSYDMLAWNDAAATLFPGLATDPHPNLARWVFTNPMAREILVDWSTVAYDVLARLRSALGCDPHDPRLAQLIQELQDASPEAAAWWSRNDVQANHSGIKQVRHPVKGIITLEHSSFQVSDQPEQTLVVYSASV
jgi:transcriptional regulator with XRE-family HTH domain